MFAVESKMERNLQAVAESVAPILERRTESVLEELIHGLGAEGWHSSDSSWDEDSRATFVADVTRVIYDAYLPSRERLGDVIDKALVVVKILDPLAKG